MRLLCSFCLLLLLLAPAATAEPKPQLACSVVDFSSLSFSRDGSRLVFFSDESYSVWDLQTFKLVASQKLDFTILDAALSPDGKLLAIGERPRRLAVLDLSNKERIFLHQGPAVAKGQDSGGYGVSFSPNGAYLVAWGTGFMREAGEPTCYLFSWPEKKLSRTFPSDVQAASCGWSEAGQLAIRTARNLRVYDPSTGKILETIEESKSSEGELSKTLFRLGLGDFSERGSQRSGFMNSPLTYEVGDRGDFAPMTFYQGTDKQPLGSLALTLGCWLSHDRQTLAVLMKTGVLLLDVKATLAAKTLVPIAGSAFRIWSERGDQTSPWGSRRR